MTELDNISDFINSPAFALMSDEVKSETTSKQIELAKSFIESKIKEVLIPLLDKYNLVMSYDIKAKKQESLSKSPKIIGKKFATKVAKTPQKGLCVFLSNGDFIQEAKAADTFAKAIRYFGPAKVRTLSLMLDKDNVILTTSDKPYPFNLREVGDGYYVNTHSNTVSKHRMLEKISKAFKLGWKVEIID